MVTGFSAEIGEDAVGLVNLMLPKLREVLGRQRRDYCLDEEAFPAQYPVELKILMTALYPTWR